MQRKLELLIIFLAVSCFGALYVFTQNKGAEKIAQYETATFSGGSFWCMQQLFDQMEGIVSTTVGYTGGNKSKPTDEEVSSGSTGHTEAVRVIFDPSLISYNTLVNTYWHYLDRASQYQTAIFYHNETQKQIAEETKVKLVESKKFEDIYTEITPVSEFYEAESYHQNYYKKNPIQYFLYKYFTGWEKKFNH